MTLDVERGLESPTSASQPALSRLITVDTHRFANEYWGEQPLLSTQGELGSDFSDLFSDTAVDELVAQRGLRTPFARMAHEGSVLAPARYTGSGGYGAEIADQLDADKVLKEFADGATLVLQGLHRTWPQLGEFTRALVDDLGHPAQVNAYITPASSRGFDPHYDVHDVFVLQIRGEKHWTIHEPVHPDPLADEPWSQHAAAVAAQAKLPPFIDATFSPGDVLYLPRGWIHSATALGGMSIHLTIGVSARTRYDIAQKLLARAGTSRDLRRSLPLGLDRLDRDALTALVREASALLEEMLEDDATVAAAARDLASAAVSSKRQEPVFPLSTIDALGSLQEHTRISWREGLEATIQRTGSTVVITLPRKSVSLPVEAADAVELLFAGEIATAGHLQGLDTASSLVVARRLLREAILIAR